MYENKRCSTNRRQVCGSAQLADFSPQQGIEDDILDADLVIGVVLVPGSDASKLVSAEFALNNACLPFVMAIADKGTSNAFHSGTEPVHMPGRAKEAAPPSRI